MPETHPRGTRIWPGDLSPASKTGAITRTRYKTQTGPYLDPRTDSPKTFSIFHVPRPGGSEFPKKIWTGPDRGEVRVFPGCFSPGPGPCTHLGFNHSNTLSISY